MYMSVCVYVCVHVDRVYVYSSMSNMDYNTRLTCNRIEQLSNEAEV